jgi:hypothetical protein
MHGIIQRPASGAYDVRRTGNHINLQWRLRPARQAKLGKGRRSRRRQADVRDIVETLMLMAAVVVAALYLLVRQGGVGI